MTIFKIKVRKNGEPAQDAFSVAAANKAQAKCFVSCVKPGFSITSLTKIGWELQEHYDFVTVSHTTHIHGVKVARKKRLEREARTA